VIVGGIIESVKRIFTKKSGKEMAFVTIANENGVTLECVVFPKSLTFTKVYWLKKCYLNYGKIDTKKRQTRNHSR